MAEQVTWRQRLPGPRWRHAPPLFVLAVAACAGILLADWLLLPAWVWSGLCAVSAAVLARWPGFPALLPVCAAVFGFAHHAEDRNPLREMLAAHLRPGGATPATLTGIITDAPEPDITGTGFTFPLQTESLAIPLIPGAPDHSLLQVRVRDFPESLRYGDRIQLTGLLRRPRHPVNPGEFDYPEYLRRQGASAEFEASAAFDQLEIVGRGAGSPVVAAALRSREWIGRAVTQDIEDDPDMAATVRAMVLGTREKTPAEIEEAFVASGTMHIFAVSGLHVAMFCTILWGVLSFLRLPRTWVLWIALPAVFFYVFITGLRPSAWRAAIMAAVVLCGPLVNRQSNLFNSLGAAALLLLGLDTQQLFQPGFTLSFGVLLALAILYPWCRRLLNPLAEMDPFLPRQLYTGAQVAQQKARRFLADSISVSTASTLGSAWLMIHYFNIITPIGIVANLFLVALSLFILSLACASLFFSAIGWAPLVMAFNNTNWLLAKISVSTAQFFASVPWGHIHCDPARLWRGSLCEITVLHLENGGGAIHIDTPNGRHWMLDAGGPRHFLRTVRPHLIRTPVNRLDGMILTHSDSGHTGAADAVRQVFQPRMEPSLTAGEELLLDEGVRLRCLFPPPVWKPRLQDDRCAVYLLECRGLRVLFMGDAGFVTEKALLESGEDLRADVLVKGQHDSDYSGLPEFINTVRPQTVVFTRSHFPESETVPEWWMKMLARKGIPFFDQSRTGAAIIRLEESGSSVSGWANGTSLPLLRGASRLSQP